MNEEPDKRYIEIKMKIRIQHFMDQTTPYRTGAQVKEKTLVRRIDPKNAFRAAAAVATIGLGVTGAIDYIRYDRELDGAKERVQLVRDASEGIREMGEGMRKMGEHYEIDMERTLGVGILIGMDRKCTRYDSAVAQRLVRDGIALNEIDQIRQDLRRIELTLRRAADQMEINEVLPSQRRQGDAMIYLGIAGLIGSALYGTRKRGEQE